MAIAIRGTTPGTTITVSNPVSLTLNGARQPNAGDVLVIIYCNDFYALSNMPTPTVAGSTSGVTAITGGEADGGTNLAHIKSFTYVVGSTGDLTVSATESPGGDEEKALAVYVLSGVDTTTPIDVAGNALDGGATHDAPSVSPTSTDAFLICHTNTGGGASSASYTPPSGMTEVYDTVVGGMSMSGATLQLSASGATGIKAFDPIDDVGAAAEVSIAVKTAAAGGPTLMPRAVIVAG